LRRAALIALVIAASPTAWSAGEPGAAPHRIQFPGFSIAMPEGEVKRKILHAPAGKYVIQPAASLSDYVHSALQLKLPEKLSMVSVSWLAQPVSADERPMQRKTLTDTFDGVRKSQTIDEHRWVDVVQFKGIFVGLGAVYCEPGLSIWVVGGAAPQVEAVALRTEQMVKSVHCEIRGALPELPQIDLPDPMQFGRTPDDHMHLVRRDGLQIYSNVAQDNIMAQQQYVDRFFRSLAANMLNIPVSRVDVTTGRLVREDRVPQMLSIINTGEVLEGTKLYISAMYCETWELTFMTIVVELPEQSGEAKKFVAAIKCPGAEPQRRLELSELFGKPCRAGKSEDCLRLVEYVEAGMADTAYGTADQLRAKVCALGDKTSCTKPVKGEKNKN
jgi:hypothetical protein